jgi:hypothetical protein
MRKCVKNNSDNNESNTTVFEFLVAWLYFIYPEAYTIQQRTDSDNQPKTMEVGGGKKRVVNQINLGKRRGVNIFCGYKRIDKRIAYMKLI